MVEARMVKKIGIDFIDPCVRIHTRFYFEKVQSQETFQCVTDIFKYWLFSVKYYNMLFSISHNHDKINLPGFQRDIYRRGTVVLN